MRIALWTWKYLVSFYWFCCIAFFGIQFVLEHIFEKKKRDKNYRRDLRFEILQTHEQEKQPTKPWAADQTPFYILNYTS